MASRIISGAFLRIIEHRVGLGDLLEPVFGARFLVAVRMVFEGQLAKGILDRLLIGVMSDAEHLVIISLVGHGHAPIVKKRYGVVC